MKWLYKMFWGDKVFSYLNTAVKILYLFQKKKKSEIQILEGQNGSKEKPGCLKWINTKDNSAREFPQNIKWISELKTTL